MKKATVKLFEKADQAIQASSRELKAGDVDTSVSRAYYAMFYVAEALLFEKGLAFKKHSAVHAAFGEHLAKTGEFDTKYHHWLREAFEKRITSDYGIDSSVSAEDASAMIPQAQEFLNQARQYLSQSG